MVRAPCCEKMGLKKGPWTPEEDQILISYIQHYGHGNWRALPKHAGLLRCGKSCRLRWTNYLRPDIKRGNFSREEEETIIKLHEVLGNRWSAIAARLPGRTDNEIKNVWHTHLKKRLKQNQATADTKLQSMEIPKCDDTNMERESGQLNNSQVSQRFDNPGNAPVSPQQSSSDFSSETDSSENNIGFKDEHIESSDTFLEIDESFWHEALSAENSDEFPAVTTDSQLQFPISEVTADSQLQFPLYAYSSNMDQDMDFWYDLFMKAEELQALPEF